MFGAWNRVVRLIGLAAAGALFMAVSGCEDGGGGLGDGHDFGDNDPNVVVAMGDSITASSYPGLLAGMIGKTVINQGHGGAKSSAGASSIRGILTRYKPGYVLIFYGANDAIHDHSTAETIGNLQAMVAAARERKTVPVLTTLTPVYAGHRAFHGGVDSITRAVRELASQEGVALADVAAAFGEDETLISADGLHPNARGQQVIADTFAGLF